MTDLKIRIAGDPSQVERLTELLRSWSKQWGERKIFRVRKYDRDPRQNPYHRTFGNASRINYVKMKLPKEVEMKMSECDSCRKRVQCLVYRRCYIKNHREEK